MRAATAIRNADIVERYTVLNQKRGQIAFIYQISTQTVTRVLNDAGIEGEWSQEQVRETPGPNEPRYKKGDCLMCHRRTYTHPEWVDGKCPVCNGTGKYPASIMDCRHERDGV